MKSYVSLIHHTFKTIYKSRGYKTHTKLHLQLVTRHIINPNLIKPLTIAQLNLHCRSLSPSWRVVFEIATWFFNLSSLLPSLSLSDSSMSLLIAVTMNRNTIDRHVPDRSPTSMSAFVDY
ncbi:hypothetical protein QVD17_25753 [Tagetes erecta]|uniref:Uncharacterized protein n=1 Tax=Tagetes erecta TaxID=13708 RepID=A0AAD8K667_TARER|nr:hypothetical protein QVD17_25753 [Tagetes erecta]